jgi:hypothetical protein
MDEERDKVAVLGFRARMPFRRKSDVVIRTFRAEALEMVPPELVVSAATVSSWRDTF